MLTLIASSLLFFGMPQDVAATAAPDAKAELVKAATKFTEAKSYRFTSLSESKRVMDGEEAPGGGPGGRGGGDRAPREPVPTKGAWKAGQPMKLVVGETTAFKEGEQVVYKNADGEWQVMEFGRGGRGGFGGGPPAGGEAGGRGQGRGGEGGGDRGGDRGGQGRGGDRAGADRTSGRNMDRGARALFGLRNVEAPHLMLADLEKKLADAKKSAEGDAVVYTGALTEEGTTALGGGGGRRFGGRGGRGGGGGGGGGGGDMTVTGTYRVEMKEGQLSKLVIEVKREGSFGERSFEMTTTRTFAFTELGKAEYEVPEEALAHFEI